MTIIIGESYDVTLPGGDLLGTVGENRLRKHRVFHPRFEGASYILRLRYHDGRIYDTQIEDGVLTVYGSLLRSAGEVEAQFRAVKTDGESEERLVFQSEIFKLRIGSAIGGSAAVIPPYEESKTMFEELLEQMKSMGTKTISTAVLAGQTVCGRAVIAKKDDTIASA